MSDHLQIRSACDCIGPAKELARTDEVAVSVCDCGQFWLTLPGSVPRAATRAEAALCQVIQSISRYNARAREQGGAMAILIDEAIWRRGNALYCHVMSDQPGQAGLDELHAFADKVGLKRSWFQNKPRFPHYDMVSGWRERAIRLGAQEVTGAELVRRCAKPV